MAIAIQSLLFVPGTRPDRFAKALASGADCVCIDLEDAVPAGEKQAARLAAIAAVSTDKRVAIRINGLRTKAGIEDLLALEESDARPALVLLPMCESPTEIAIARGVLGDDTICFVPLLETVDGIASARDIAAQPGVAGLMFGGADYSAQLGIEMAWEPLVAARAAIMMAAAAEGRYAIDVPFVDIADESGLLREAKRSKAMGFAAKAAIHPAQISAIHRAFRPSAEDIAEAQEAVAAFEAANGAAVKFRGRMLEAPFMARYRKILSFGDSANA
jgi:(S)-citramalyl-CoA lyase